MKKHKHAELIKAWADGAEIEFLNVYTKGWSRATAPNWAENMEYRIKPQPKIMPFTWEDRELLRGKWAKSKVYDIELYIGYINVEGINSNSASIRYDDLFRNYTFLDGSPCGK